jgi:hypothetical protein
MHAGSGVDTWGIRSSTATGGEQEDGYNKPELPAFMRIALPQQRVYLQKLRESKIGKDRDPSARKKIRDSKMKDEGTE